MLLWRSGGDGIKSSNSTALIGADVPPGSAVNDSVAVGRLERAVTALELEIWVLKRALRAGTDSSSPPQLRQPPRDMVLAAP